VDLAAKHRLFAAVTRAFSLAAEHAPHLLIIDDLGRTDPTSLELLHYWLAELPRMRILLLATVRSDAGGAASTLLSRAVSHRNCARLRLAPLHEAQVRDYVRALLEDADEKTCRVVFERSEGNPLFMTELVRQLRESERPDAAALRTPAAALDLLERRSAGLDAATCSLLVCAAVIGRSFSLALLAELTGTTRPQVMESLDLATAREIMKLAPDSTTDFVFAHELLRAALYERLEPAARRAWHVRVAQALQSRVALGEVGDRARLSRSVGAA
jgi:predicted ATPase